MAHDPTDEDRRAYAFCAEQYKGGCACERNRVEPCAGTVRDLKAADRKKKAEERRRKAAEEKAAALEAAAKAEEEAAADPAPAPAPDEGGDGGDPPSEPPAEDGGEAPKKPRKPKKRARSALDDPPPLALGLRPEERLHLDENDADNAARLYSVIGDRVLFVHGKGWAVVRGGRYDFRSGELRAFELGSRLRAIVEEEARAAAAKEVTDEEAMTRLALETRKQRAAFETLEEARTAVKIEAFGKMMKHATRCANNAMIERALFALRHHVSAEIEDLDSDPAILVVPNGLIDLEAVAGTEWPAPGSFADEEDRAKAFAEIRKGWRRDHDLSSLPTKSAGAKFDPAADCPEWRAFVSLIMPEPAEQAALQRACGMVVYGRNDAQVALLLRGPGGNGKSTFIEALRAVLGDYAQPCKIEMFITTQNDSPGRPTPEEVDLPGARALIASEPDPTDELSSKKIKAMTGGDLRPARALGMPQFTYRPNGVPILSFNRTPRIKGEDDGTRRRLFFIPFEVNLRELPADRQKSQREVEAMLEQERSGILNWLLEGFHDFRARGLAPPAKWRDLKSDLLADSDPVGEFIKDCCLTGPETLRVGASEFYRVYQEWCSRTGAHEYTQRTLTKIMTEKRFGRVKTGGGRMFWSGVRWLEPADAAEGDDAARERVRGLEDLLKASGFSEDPAPSDQGGSGSSAPF